MPANFTKEEREILFVLLPNLTNIIFHLVCCVIVEQEYLCQSNL